VSYFLQKEIFDVGGTKRDVSNQLVRTDTVDIVNKLRLTVPGNLVQLDGGDADYVNATPGIHGFPELDAEWTHLNTVGAGVICDRQLIVSDNSIVQGVHFRGDSNPLVSVKAKTTPVNNAVIFRSCMFERTDQAKSPVWVAVESGALVVLIGCVFRGGKYPNLGGVIVSNQGAAAKVQLSGCISTTGLAYSTVTSAGQGNINT
tara:strand:+ start:6590 stop:7198 length:609 start_codon:yes stop_codon:yes gene_type:complete